MRLRSIGVRLLDAMQQTMSSRGKSLDVWLALYTLVYGVWLMLPLDTCASTLALSGLCRYAPEWIWGGIVAALGVLKLVVLARNGTAIQRKRVLQVMGIVWLFLGANAFLANPASTAGPTYVLAFCGLAYCYLRVSQSEQ